LHPLRIDEIIWETRSKLTNNKKDYKIFIEFKEPIDEEMQLTIMGNEHLVKTAIVNLMDNACKFSPDNSARISLYTQGKNIVTEISDNGPGVDQADLENIFHPFFRAKNTRNIPGNGLGLPLAKKIIELHKGTVSIDSVVNKGTTAFVSFPYLS
jgi:signal transduction histidine kinase